MKYLLEFAQYLSTDIQDLDKDGKKDNPVSASAPYAKVFDPNKKEVIGRFEKGVLVEELFTTTAGVIAAINRKIVERTNLWYGKFGYKYDKNLPNRDLKVGDLIISSEHIMKMVNNRTVFYKICKEENIKSGEALLAFMTDFSNMKKCYHWTGSLFPEILKILTNASSKGAAGEEQSFGYYKWFMKTKGIDIDILPPSLSEDISGIDGKFYIDDKLKTIQVKPYEAFVIEGRIGKATSNGSLSMNTDILILYKKIGMKKIEKYGKEYIVPVYSFIIADDKNVDIDGNQFILKKWEAKGEKTR
jgi:hypothetical protein